MPPEKSRLNPAARKTLEALQSPGQPSIYDHLKKVFVESSEKFLITLSDAAIEQKLLERTAHSWKGIAQGMGATELADLCLKLEMLAQNPGAGEREPVLAAIRDEYALVRAELTAQP